MDKFIKSLSQDYELVQYRIKDANVIFYIQSNKKELQKSQLSAQNFF